MGQGQHYWSWPPPWNPNPTPSTTTTIISQEQGGARPPKLALPPSPPLHPTPSLQPARNRARGAFRFIKKVPEHPNSVSSTTLLVISKPELILPEFRLFFFLNLKQKTIFKAVKQKRDIIRNSLWTAGLAPYPHTCSVPWVLTIRAVLRHTATSCPNFFTL